MGFTTATKSFGQPGAGRRVSAHGIHQPSHPTRWKGSCSLPARARPMGCRRMPGDPLGTPSAHWAVTGQCPYLRDKENHVTCESPRPSACGGENLNINCRCLALEAEYPHASNSMRAKLSCTMYLLTLKTVTGKPLWPQPQPAPTGKYPLPTIGRSGGKRGVGPLPFTEPLPVTVP